MEIIGDIFTAYGRLKAKSEALLGHVHAEREVEVESRFENQN